MINNLTEEQVDKVLASIHVQAAAIGELQARIKADAMIYQKEGKDTVWKFYNRWGVDIRNPLYDLPVALWYACWQQYDKDSEHGRYGMAG